MCLSRFFLVKFLYFLKHSTRGSFLMPATMMFGYKVLPQFVIFIRRSTVWFIHPFPAISGQTLSNWHWLILDCLLSPFQSLSFCFGHRLCPTGATSWSRMHCADADTRLCQLCFRGLRGEPPTLLGKPTSSKTDEFSEKFQTAIGPPPLIFRKSHCKFFQNSWPKYRL